MVIKDFVKDELDALGISRLFPKKKNPGRAPGTIVFTGERKEKETKLKFIDYTKKNFKEKDMKNIEESFSLRDTKSVTWINVAGLHDVSVMEKIGRHFGIHPLVLEDVANVNQRPKVESYDGYVFVVGKMISYNKNRKMVTIDQISLIVGKNYVISFQEREGDVFDPVRQRIKDGNKRIRQRGNDYLAYALLDAMVDHYFVVLESIGDNAEELEHDLFANPSPKLMNSLHKLKRELVFMRKSVWPLREVIGSMYRGEIKIFGKETEVYLRDVYDHTLQVMDGIEALRDLVSGMFDTYLSSVSNRMNEVMKTLTIIATIFIPLTFIAGIYGMNFANMPELSWEYGYFLSLGVMAIVAVVMIFYFRRKQWL